MYNESYRPREEFRARIDLSAVVREATSSRSLSIAFTMQHAHPTLSVNRAADLEKTTLDPGTATRSGGTKLARELGLFDSTMLVMGGIVGAGLFINPYVVAERVHSPALILAVWVAGGIVAMLGAFIYAELADRMPNTGGEYAYLRDCYHPLVGFLFGWVLLLVVMTGGMAAVAVTFARYFLTLTGLQVSERIVVVITLATLTIVNCFGAKLGSRVQSSLMVMKIAVIAGVILAGFLLVHHPYPVLRPILPPLADRSSSMGLVTAFGSAMIPVLFAYGGWQTSNFIASEIRDPRRNLTRALMIGVAGVILLYVAMNVVCVRVLGAEGLAATRVPATAVMEHALGSVGARLVAFGIAVSTLAFSASRFLPDRESISPWPRTDCSFAASRR